MTAQVELNMFIGAAYGLAVEWVAREASGAQGAPVDLTGVELVLRVMRQGQTVFEASTMAGSIVMTAPARGLFEIAFGADALEGLAPGVYEHTLTPLRGGEARAPFWVGRANLRANGVSGAAPLRVIGPAIAPARILAQGADGVLTTGGLPDRARAGVDAAAAAGFAARLEALEARGDDLAGLAEALEQMRGQITTIPAQRAMAIEAAPAAPGLGDIDAAIEALGLRIAGVERRPAFDAGAIDEALALMSRRLTALEQRAAPTAWAFGTTLAPGAEPVVDDPFAATLLAFLRAAGPAEAVFTPDLEDPSTWRVRVGAWATKEQVARISEALEAAAAFRRFAVLDQKLFILAVADRRPGRSLWPAEGLRGAPAEAVPLPHEARIAIGGRIVAATIYPPDELLEASVGAPASGVKETAANASA